MKGKLLLVGGISSSGKTTLCEQLALKAGVENRRLHHYIFQSAGDRSIPEVLDNWDHFSIEGMKRLIEDSGTFGALSCDHHFAIQPVYDTAYAQGIKVEEDMDEPYQRSLSEGVLRLPEFSDVELCLLLINANPSEILRRRKEQDRAPRSLDPESIRKEIEAEKRFFYESATVIGEQSKPQIYEVSSESGRLDQTFKKVSELCKLGGP